VLGVGDEGLAVIKRNPVAVPILDRAGPSYRTGIAALVKDGVAGPHIPHLAPPVRRGEFGFNPQPLAALPRHQHDGLLGFSAENVSLPCVRFNSGAPR
jgi:hypothetical protein